MCPTGFTHDKRTFVCGWKKFVTLTGFLWCNNSRLLNLQLPILPISYYTDKHVIGA